jgi:hypothetical protein
MNNTARRGINWRAICTLAMAGVITATVLAWVATLAGAR